MSIHKLKLLSILALATLSVQSIACVNTRSHYQASRVPAKEITWDFDNGLQFKKNNTVVAEFESWDKLSKAVSCVPGAKAYADRAAFQKTSAYAMIASGLAIVAGSIINLAVQDTTDFNTIETNLSVAGAGFALSAVGGLVWGPSRANGVDAVNYYNDHYETTPACQ